MVSNKDTYKIEYEITGLTKKEAIDFINEIHNLYNDKYLTKAKVNTNYGIKNERTKHYTYDLTDQY